jgi:hypothetical protein
MVVPLAPGWSAQTPWTRAWQDPMFSHGAVPLVLPPDDKVDEPALASIHFDTAAWADVEPMASRLHATEAYLVLVIPQHAQMLVKIRHLAASAAAAIPDFVVPTPPNTPAPKAFGEVADAAAKAIIESWKSRAAVDFSKRSKLLASVRFDTLEEWARTLQRLEAVQTVNDVNLVAMDIGEARVSISYAGSPEQLTEQLARAGFALSNESGEWRLARSEAGAQQ